MVFKDGEGDELVLVLELLLVDDFVKQSCDMFRRIVKGTATESTEHDAVVSVQQTDSIVLILFLVNAASSSQMFPSLSNSG